MIIFRTNDRLSDLNHGEIMYDVNRKEYLLVHKDGSSTYFRKLLDPSEISCKQCIHRDDEGFCHEKYYCDGSYQLVKPSDFCSSFKKKGVS